MTRRDLARAIAEARPELPEGLHLPRLAVVSAIPAPPTGGETSTHEAPRYAVDCRLLTPRLEYDPDLPELLGVPVALPAAGAARGLAALPQVGTVVEVAFAYGQLHLPYIRLALPYDLPLPAIAADTMRLQYTAATWQQADAAGWQRQTPAAIADDAGTTATREAGEAIADVAPLIAQEASEQQSHTAPISWYGSEAVNLLQTVVDQLGVLISTLTSHAGHTHSSFGSNPPSDAATLTAAATSLTTLQTALAAITAPTP
jgi:hypothetical protein